MLATVLCPWLLSSQGGMLKLARSTWSSCLLSDHSSLLVRRDCLQPVNPSCLVPVVCNMVLSAVQQRSTSLQYPLVRAVTRSVAYKYSYSLPGRALCSWRRLTCLKLDRSLSILVLSVGLLLGLWVFCTTIPSPWMHDTDQDKGCLSPPVYYMCC